LRCEGHAHKGDEQEENLKSGCNRKNLTRMQKGDGRGKGVRVFGLVLHGRVATNLGFNKPLGFDNQTLFCLF
jgi:hypothetical protein